MSASIIGLHFEALSRVDREVYYVNGIEVLLLYKVYSSEVNIYTSTGLLKPPCEIAIAGNSRMRNGI